jgi:hypothetical protein
VADRVVLHVGLPKTGTTYLQSVLWRNRRPLRRQGLLYPGRSRRQHMWASMVVREHPGLTKRSPAASRSWDELLAEVRDWPGTALISHEFFGAATEAQARRAIERLGETEVHVVATARDILTVTTSRWQEYVRHGFGGVELDDFPPRMRAWNEWGWGSIDLESVLRRWSGDLPPERVHVIVVPGRDAPRRALVDEFVGILGVDASSLDVEQAQANTSLGVVEVELLRRLAPKLKGFSSALDRGVWIRSYLAEELLVPLRGDRFLPGPERVEELRDVADRTVAYLEASGFSIHGDLERLRVPAELPAARHPSSVTQDELMDVATTTIARMMEDVRRFRSRGSEVDRAVVTPESEPAAVDRARSSVSGLARRLRRAVGLGRRSARPSV